MNCGLARNQSCRFLKFGGCNAYVKKFQRSDRGGEYLSYEFGLHLKQCGIVLQLMPPGTPQRNGLFERYNHTLLDIVQSMMFLTDLPISFWDHALETAAFTLKRGTI